jgi:hypothetical protein
MGKRAQREATRFDFAAQRRDMVEHHIAARGVRSESVLRAMRAVRREEFLPSNLREFAYEDSPLPIASGQTISQPLCVPKTSSAEIPVPAPKFPVPPMASALFAPR